jgi:hypothetical protein
MRVLFRVFCAALVLASGLVLGCGESGETGKPMKGQELKPGYNKVEDKEMKTKDGAKKFSPGTPPVPTPPSDK